MAATASELINESGLPKKQQLFVQEYLVDMNGTQAAIRSGYSKRTANEQAAQLLAKLSIRDLIAKCLEIRSAKLQIDATWVLTRLVKEAQADLAALFDDEGGVKSIHEWPIEWRQGLVAGIEVEEQYESVEEPDDMEPQGHGGALRRPAKRKVAMGRVVKLKLADRHKKLELIGRHVNVNAFKVIDGGKGDETESFMDAIGGFGIRPAIEAGK